jgi:TolB protein
MLGALACSPQEVAQITNSEQTASPDRIVFEGKRQGVTDIYVVNGDGTQLRNLTNSAAADNWPAWSPDGKQVVFATQNGDYDLYIVNADGTDLRALTDNTVDDRYPQWSQDGTRILYTSYPDGPGRIYVVNVDGTAPRPIVDITMWGRQGLSANEEFPYWSPNGAQVLFYAKNPEQAADVYRINLNGRDMLNMSETGNVVPNAFAWSPDGSLIAYMTGSNPDLYVINFNANDEQRKRLARNVETSSPPIWSPDGTQIAYIAEHQDGTPDVNGQPIYDLNVIKADGSDDPINLTNGAAPASMPHWMPDGSAIIFWSDSAASGPGHRLISIKPDGTEMKTLIEDTSFEDISGQRWWHP